MSCINNTKCGGRSTGPDRLCYDCRYIRSVINVSTDPVVAIEIIDNLHESFIKQIKDIKHNVKRP
jgi:hypothetical protein